MSESNEKRDGDGFEDVGANEKNLLLFNEIDYEKTYEGVWKLITEENMRGDSNSRSKFKTKDQIESQINLIKGELAVKLTESSRDSKKESLELNLLSIALLKSCSERMVKLLEVDEFNLNHFKKGMEIFNSVFRIITQNRQFNVLKKGMGDIFVSLYDSFITLICHADNVNYENKSFLIKLLAVLTSFGLMHTSESKRIECCFKKHEIQLEEFISSTGNESNSFPGSISLMTRMTDSRKSNQNLIHAIQYCFPEDLNGFIKHLKMVLPELNKAVNGIMRNEDLLESINSLILFQAKSEFHSELSSAVLLQKMECIYILSSIESRDFLHVQLRTLLAHTAENFSRLQQQGEVLAKYLSFNHQKLFQPEEKFPDFIFVVLHEILDHNLSLNLIQESNLILLLRLALIVIDNGLNFNDDFIEFYLKCKKSTLSFFASLSYLNFILIECLMETINTSRTKIPSVIRNLFSFKTIPPVSKNSSLYSSSFPEEQNMNFGNTFKAIVECLDKASSIQTKMHFHRSLLNKTQLKVQGLGSHAKICSKSLDILVGSILSSEILITKLGHFVNEEPGFDLEYLRRSLGQSNVNLMSYLITIYGKLSVLCLLNSTTKVCLQDLRLIPICLNYLNSCLNIENVKTSIFEVEICYSAFTQFLEQFGDPTVQTWNNLVEGLPLIVNKKTSVKIQSKEFKKLRERLKVWIDFSFIEEQETSTAQNSYNKPDSIEVQDPQVTSYFSPASSLVELLSPQTDEFNFKSTLKLENESKTNPSQTTSPDGVIFAKPGNISTTFAPTPFNSIPRSFISQEESAKFRGNQNFDLGSISEDYLSQRPEALANSFGTPLNHNEIISPNVLYNTATQKKVLQVGNYQPALASNSFRSPQLTENFHFPNTSRAQSIHVDDFEKVGSVW